MSRLIDITGKTFGRWLVIEQAESRGRRHTYWNCICKCGKRLAVSGDNLKGGKSKSCGCLIKEKSTKHGMWGTSEYKIHNSMKQRCNNPNDKNYDNYGGRGIAVCERWGKFENFYADMGKRPNEMTLERIDNEKGYSPDNCKWATKFEQSCNTRNNNKIIGVQQLKSGNYRWKAKKGTEHYSGTCKTKELAATAYDNKNEELGRGRPNKTTRAIDS